MPRKENDIGAENHIWDPGELPERPFTRQSIMRWFDENVAAIGEEVTDAMHPSIAITTFGRQTAKIAADRGIKDLIVFTSAGDWSGLEGVYEKSLSSFSDILMEEVSGYRSWKTKKICGDIDDLRDMETRLTASMAAMQAVLDEVREAIEVSPA